MVRPGDLRDFTGETGGVVFLGAGASIDSGLPLGDEAAAAIIRACFRATGLARIFVDLERTRASGQPALWPRFEVVLDFMEQYLPGSALEVLETFKDVGISAVHQLLAEHLKGHWLWLTTNFDDQIERALTATGAKYTVLRSRGQIAQIGRLLREHHVVVKLHGDAKSRPTEVGVTIHQILRTFPGHLARRLVRAAAGKPVLFVGYGARDPDLTIVVEGMIARSGKLAWIGKGRITPRVEAVLASCLSNYSYYGQGAANAFRRHWGVKPPAPYKSMPWFDRIAEWARRKAQNPHDRKSLFHFLAALGSRWVSDNRSPTASVSILVSASQFSACQLRIG